MTAATTLYRITLRPDSVDLYPIILRVGFGPHAIPMDVPVGLTQARIMLQEWIKNNVPSPDISALENAIHEIETARNINQAMKGATDAC